MGCLPTKKRRFRSPEAPLFLIGPCLRPVSPCRRRPSEEPREFSLDIVHGEWIDLRLLGGGRLSRSNRSFVLGRRGPARRRLARRGGGRRGGCRSRRGGGGRLPGEGRAWRMSRWRAGLLGGLSIRRRDGSRGRIRRGGTLRAGGQLIPWCIWRRGSRPGRAGRCNGALRLGGADRLTRGFPR